MVPYRPFPTTVLNATDPPVGRCAVARDSRRPQRAEIGVDDFDGESTRLGVIEERAADQLLETIGRLIDERLVIGRTVNADVPATVANESQEPLAFRVRHRRIGQVIDHDVVLGEVGEPGAVGRSLDGDAVGPENVPKSGYFSSNRWKSNTSSPMTRAPTSVVSIIVLRLAWLQHNDGDGPVPPNDRIEGTRRL